MHIKRRDPFFRASGFRMSPAEIRSINVDFDDMMAAHLAPIMGVPRADISIRRVFVQPAQEGIEAVVFDVGGEIEHRKAQGAVTYQCSRCSADPQPANFGNPRACAFLEDGSFTPENWNCATIGELLNIIPTSFEHDGDDESMQGILCDPNEARGWILMARYKHRGCTSSAIHFGDGIAEPMTLALAEATLAYHFKFSIPAEAQKPSSIEP